VSEDDSLLGGPAAFQVFAKGGKGGNGIMNCPAHYQHCLTLHCRGRYGKFNVSVSCKNGKMCLYFQRRTKQSRVVADFLAEQLLGTRPAIIFVINCFVAMIPSLIAVIATLTSVTIRMNERAGEWKGWIR
jgi:hypothetical protein